MSEREREVDELLRDFQRACETVIHQGDRVLPSITAHRALLRNELRQQLLDTTARAVRCEGERDLFKMQRDTDYAAYQEHLENAAKDSARLDWLEANYAAIEWLVPNSDPAVCEVMATFEGVRREGLAHGDGYDLRAAIDGAMK